MNDLCDVQECNRATYMGWRPLTERRVRQICQKHWRKHLDEKDSFDLFDEFKFRRPLGILKPLTKKNIPHYSCGLELDARQNRFNNIFGFRSNNGSSSKKGLQADAHSP